MSNRRKPTCNKNLLKSPWLNPRLDSLLNYEFKLCEYARTEPSVKVNNAINWIYQHGNEQDLRVHLAENALLIRLDHPSAETWISQPASSADTTVIVCGFDFNGKLRTEGSNGCTQPHRRCSTAVSAPEFFARFDHCKSKTSKIWLLQDILDACVCGLRRERIDQSHENCRNFRAQAVYLIVLTNDEPLLAHFPAVVHGRRLRDLSPEKVEGA